MLWPARRCLPASSRLLASERTHESLQDIWRYSSWMGIELKPQTLFNRQAIFHHAEFWNHSGLFKNCGAGLMDRALHQLGGTRVVEDSSGNSGACLAAYAPGLACWLMEVYLWNPPLLWLLPHYRFYLFISAPVTLWWSFRPAAG